MAYSYHATITIDHNQVAANETNFPILISGTYNGTGGEPDIRTAANGGNIQNTASGGASGSVTVPADLVFSPNTDGSSPYDFEIQSYDAATGAIIAWVKIPSLSSSTDITFYLVYGDSGVTTSQEDIANTWSDNFDAVWHLSEASGTVYDSAGSNDLTANNTPTYGATGQIGDCISFDDASSEYLSISAAIVSVPFTLSCWYNTDDNTVDKILMESQDYDGGAAGEWHRLQLNDSPDHYIRAQSFDSTVGSAASSTTYSTGTWQFATGVWAAAADRRAYLNAGSKGTESTSLTPASLDTFTIGAQYRSDGVADPMSGSIDEARVASVARDDDYITTDYNTQNDPGSFYTMGTEQAASTVPPLYYHYAHH